MYAKFSIFTSTPVFEHAHMLCFVSALRMQTAKSKQRQASQGQARRSKETQSKATPSGAKQSNAKQSKATQSRVVGVTRMMAKIWPKFGHSFGHRWPFLVPDGPPLALLRSVLPVSIRPGPDLNRSYPNFDR